MLSAIHVLSSKSASLQTVKRPRGLVLQWLLEVMPKGEGLVADKHGTTTG
jgi:hypothetical protein